MRKLGVVSRTFRNKILIVATPGKIKPPSRGEKVYLPDSTPVGKVIDVIGPVNKPLVLALPHPRFKPERLAGRTLYYTLPPRPRRHAQARGRGPRSRLRRRGRGGRTPG